MFMTTIFLFSHPALTPVPEKQNKSSMSDLRAKLAEDASQLLGGHRALAEGLGVSERSVRMWINGDRNMRDGVLHDIRVLLYRRADDCRLLADTVNDFPKSD